MFTLTLNATKKKIAQISKFYPPYKGGIELVAQMISRAHENDHVEIVSFGEKDNEYIGDFGEVVHQKKMDYFIMSTPISLDLIFHPEDLLRLKSFDKIYIHIQNPFIHVWLFVFYWLFRESGVKLVCVYHSDIVKGVIGHIFDTFFIMTSFIYDEFIVSSPKIKKHSNILKHIDNGLIKVNPFPVYGEERFIHKDSFRKKLLAIGRMVPYKGFAFLVDVINKYPEYELHLIGSGPLLDELKKKASHNVTFHGRVSEELKEELLENTDVLIVPSLTKAEAYGMISVEAFQKSIPVIASNINTGVTYLVQNMKTGLVFEPLDERGLIMCLKALEDEKVFKGLKEGCFNFYKNTLIFEKFQERLVEERSL